MTDHSAETNEEQATTNHGDVRLFLLLTVTGIGMVAAAIVAAIRPSMETVGVTAIMAMIMLIIAVRQTLSARRRAGELEKLRAELDERVANRTRELDQSREAAEDVAERLALSEERFALAVEGMMEGLWDWNPQTNDVWLSKQFKRLLGYRPGEFPDDFEKIKSVIHPDDHDATLAILRRHLESGHPYDHEFRVKTKRGEYRWFRSRGVAKHDENNQAIRMVSAIQDIHDHRLARQRTEMVVKAAPIAIVIIDDTGRMTMANETAEELLGYTREEMEGRHVDMLIPERFRGHEPGRSGLFAKYGNSVIPMTRRDPIEAASRSPSCLCKDGTEIPVHINVNPIETEEGRFVLASIVDLTERQRAQAALVEVNEQLQQKNEEMERFVYTVSHDLKSPIVTMSGFVGLLREKLDEGPKEKLLHYMSRIESGANRMRNSINDLLELSRIGRVSSEPEMIDTNELIGRITQELAERVEQKGAKLWVQPELPRLFGDRLQVAHLFENLMSNAIKYGCSGSSPHVEIGGATLNGETRLYVRDDGPGIPQEFHGKVFGLFQRLDTSQEGTGVGLAIVARIMEVHGGRAWIESDDSHQGTTVWVAFPEVEASVSTS